MGDEIVVECAEEVGLLNGFGRSRADGLCHGGDGGCWRHFLPIFWNHIPINISQTSVSCLDWLARRGNVLTDDCIALPL